MQIKIRRKQLGLSQEKVAKFVGISKTTISKLENGDILSIKHNKIEALAEILKIPAYELLGLDSDAKEKDVISIPILSTIKNRTELMTDENIVGYIDERKSDLDDGKYFYLHFKETFMMPAIPKGSKALIKMNRVPENRSIGAFLFSDNEEIMLYRIFHCSGETVLVPDNRKNDPILLSDRKNYEYLGQVCRITYDI